MAYMREAILYYATNRRHRGDDQWNPAGYCTKAVSRDGADNLRFGKVKLNYDPKEVDRCLAKQCGFGTGDGNELAKYLLDQCDKEGVARIEAFREQLDPQEEDTQQKKDKFGSTSMYKDLQRKMANGDEVLVFIHGFNVGWWDAVASAMSLQFVLNSGKNKKKQVHVVLFTWPSGGRLKPLVSYHSHRSVAVGSGACIARGVLKLRDQLIRMWRKAKRQAEEPCRGNIHLLCHSMGNYVLQQALEEIKAHSQSGKLPRIFDQIFLCAADIGDDALESGKPMQRLPEMGRSVTVYYNKEDLALFASDATKGNADRLGEHGPNRPGDLDGRVHSVDCSPVVKGFKEHTYHNCGVVKDDIRQSIEDVPPDDSSRNRVPTGNGWPNAWRMRL